MPLLLLLSACNLAAETPATPTATPHPATATPVPSTATPVAIPTQPVTEVPTLTPTAIVSLIPAELAGTGDNRFVRDEPNTLAPVSRVVNKSAPWDALGRSDDNQWLQVEFVDNSTGWIIYVPESMSVDMGSLPVTGESRIIDHIALVSAQDQVLYNETGDAILTDLPLYTALQINQRSDDGEWLHVSVYQGQSGWVARLGLSLSFAPETLIVHDFSPVDATSYEGQVAEAELNGQVKADAGGLRLRQLPTLDGKILLNLFAGTRLAVRKRTSDSTWLLVQLREGYLGWVSADYVDLDIDLASVIVDDNPQPVPYFTPPTPEGGPQVTIIGGGARAIFLDGQQRGNHANVFTTVGDSLTDTPYFLRPIPYGFDLGAYGYLLPMLQFFNVDTGQGNAYARRAISTHAGWSTFSVLEPADDGVCQPGETHLDCEYRVVKPAYAIILIGTNDAPAFPGDTYRANMQRIIETSINYGVVPILSTVPPRNDFNDRVIEYNQVIQQLSALYAIPQIDLYTALLPLPDRGLGPDGIHLSVPPGAPASTMIFSEQNLRYGTTMRNLTTLQALDQARTQIGY